MRSLLALAALALPACAILPKENPAPGSPSADWRTVATSDDRERLSEWRTAFTRALDKARKAGHAADIAREGRLLEPDAATGPVPIPNGDYRCRVIKIGAKSEGLLDYVAYPAFRCRIGQAGAVQSFAKLTGSQRHVGNIFRADPLRQVFLGTLVLSDETRAFQYGRDPDRDVAGWVERIEPARWRLILPYPHFESTIDVVELIPETAQ
jgi:hypothetical protein